MDDKVARRKFKPLIRRELLGEAVFSLTLPTRSEPSWDEITASEGALAGCDVHSLLGVCLGWRTRSHPMPFFFFFSLIL